MFVAPEAITIRPAARADEAPLRRLAALDSANPPRPPLVLAEVDGELRVAVSAVTRSAIADPFHPTADLVALVRDHIARSRPSAARRPIAAPGGRGLRFGVDG